MTKLTVRRAFAIIFISAFALLYSLWVMVNYSAAREEGPQALVAPTRLPDSQSLFLEENVGQFDPRGRFLLRHDSGKIWLTEDGIWITLQDQQALRAAREFWIDGEGIDRPIPAVNIKLRFLGANPAPVMEPFYRQDASFSYLLGDGEADWHASVPVWGGVRYWNLYPGVNLVISAGDYPSNGVLLPWHLELDKDADLSGLALSIAGVEGLTLRSDQIRLQTAIGSFGLSLLATGSATGPDTGASTLALPKPSVGQSGIETFVVDSPITGGSPVVAQDGSVLTGTADLLYSTYLGGGDTERANGVAVDGTGAIYVVGNTSSTDFPTTPGSYDATLNSQDVYVAKIDPAGTGSGDLIYATFIGGSTIDFGLSIAQSAGRAFITGETLSNNYPTTSGAYDTTCGDDALCDGHTDAFITQLNAAGTDLAYSSYLGASHDDQGNGIVVSGGELYIAGTTKSDDFPTTANAFDRTCGTDGTCNRSSGQVVFSDAFFVKFNPAGNGNNDLLYGTFLGGRSRDLGNAVAASGGDGFITGRSDSFDFPATGYVNGNDAFVVRIDPAGNQQGDRVYGTFLGSQTWDVGNGIDARGSTAYVIGETDGADFPATEGAISGDVDTFLALLDGTGAITYASFIGGSGEDIGSSVAVEDSGVAILVGYTKSSDFPVTAEAFDTVLGGASDAYVVAFNLDSTDPQHITYATYLGGSTLDEAYDLAIDGLGHAFVAGATNSTDFPTTTNAFDTALDGVSDATVSVLQVVLPPGINIEKSTNDFDADEPPGPYVPVGSPIAWHYVVTNTGGYTLTNVQVNDDQLGFVCSQASLEPEGSFFCDKTGTAAPDQYFNAATVTADAPPELGLDPVTDIDLSYYFGALPAVNLEKYTNGYNADSEPGPFIRIGDPLTWTYVVTNTGNVRLDGIVVTDSLEGPAVCDYTFLQRNQTATCVITATAGALTGPYANTGYVQATPPGGLADVTDQDSSHYFGADPSVNMLKLTNAQTAHDLPGPYILANDPVTWTYIITNTGNVTISVSAVVDDQGVLVTCPNPEVPVDGSTACAGTELAIAGQYTNTAEVQAAPPVGDPVTAVDSSHYYGVDPAVLIKKLTNGLDVAQAPGPFIPEGDPVGWTYIVTNTGNITLTALAVTDSQGVAVNCDAAPVSPGQAKVCTASGTAVSGQYSNTAGVLATPLFGPDVSSTDDSYYYGSSPAISVAKRTNGILAESEPGPYIKTGDPVTWTYEISNTGNITLTGIVVTDDRLGPVSCASAELGQGQMTTCQATGLASAGQYSNTVTAVGVPPVGQNVSGTAMSYYYGVSAEISLKKLTNGQPGDNPPGPYVTAGDPVTWTFIVSNTGNSALTAIILTDDQLGPVTCPLTELASGQQMSCQATGAAATGQYTNTATVEGTPPAGPNVTAQDTSHYFGVAAQVAIRKFTNGQAAPLPPGPFIPEGDLVTWSYAVTNTGNITLTTIVVTDDQGVTVECAASSLGLDEATLCTATGVAASGQYSNTGSVSATPLFGLPVMASDISHYYGSSPDITLVKRTNGQIARSAPGPYILLGDSVDWTYDVTNSGNITLTGIVLVDNPLGTISCPTETLGMGEAMSCQAAGLAAAGQYSNTAVITGTPPVGQQVTANDISYYFGADPAVVLRKLTNGQDANAAPGPLIPEGDLVSWSYVVTNTGNITLTTLVVTDNQGVAVNCAASPVGPGQARTCTATGPAVSGQYSNTGTVLATPLFGPDVTWSDVSHYYGSSPGITVAKRTNGVLSASEPGPYIEVGDAVTWTYEVSNSGNITLTGIVLTDDRLGIVDCPGNSLAAGQSMTCQATGVASAGQYSNTVTAVGVPPVGQNVSGTDIGYYYGVAAEISLKKLTNGQPGDSAPGPYVTVGEPVTWTFIISNTGNSALTGITLTDDQLGDVTCPLTALASGQQMTCQVIAAAIAGQYANTAAVEGTPPVGLNVTAQDASHYYGVAASVAVEKLTNGVKASAAPGPYILEGDPVAWTYIITNTGNITLTTIIVTDSKGEEVTCGQSSLGLNGAMTCTASGVAGSGQYSNTAQVTAVPLFGPPQVNASDTSFYFGMSPELMLTKHTNDQIARTTPGPYILVGDPVTWTYNITNSGNITLSAITLVDDQLGPILCPRDVLDAGESMLCQQSGVAAAGQYTNTATVTGTPTAAAAAASATLRRPFSSLARIAPVSRSAGEAACSVDQVSSGLEPICAPDEAVSVDRAGHLARAPGTSWPEYNTVASDTSYYFGADPVIVIRKTTNGLLAGQPPGPFVDFRAGDTVTWTITVSNTGNVLLDPVLVVDDQGTPGDPSDDITCEFGALAVDQPAQSCTFSAVSVAGQYSNKASVSATPPGGLAAITRQAVNYYFGSDPSISLIKYTNNVDAAAPPGPILLVDWPVVWTYEVRNTGNYTLTQLAVLDQEGMAVAPGSAVVVCEIEALGPGLSRLCTLEGIVALGQYTNTGSVSGLPPIGEMVVDQDRSYYFGARGLFLPMIIGD